MHQPLSPLRALLLAAAVLAAAGCSTAPRLGPQADRLPPRVELTQVPFFAQDEYQCGPAALATLLNQRGLGITPQALKDRVYLPGREGSLQVELVAAAREQGLLVYPLAPQLDALLAEVAAGNPVLVLQNLAFDWYPRWHFAVLVGYDRPRNELVLRSGTTRRWVTDMATFYATWARGQRWAVVLMPPEQLPATAQPLRWLQAARDLEQTGQGSAALKAWLAATRQWPDSSTAWFALGNRQYADGDRAGAAQALIRAAAGQPPLAAAWSNLAHVLGEQGCAQQAAQAGACARRLSDDPRLAAGPWSARRGARCPPLPVCPAP